MVFGLLVQLVLFACPPSIGSSANPTHTLHWIYDTIRYCLRVFVFSLPAARALSLSLSAVCTKERKKRPWSHGDGKQPSFSSPLPWMDFPILTSLKTKPHSHTNTIISIDPACSSTTGPRSVLELSSSLVWSGLEKHAAAAAGAMADLTIHPSPTLPVSICKL